MIQDAIAANLPLVKVTTTDTVNYLHVLEHFCGDNFAAFKTMDRTQGIKYIYAANDSLVPEDVYHHAVETKSCVIWINPTIESPCFFDAGVLPTPHDLLYDYLSEFMSENQFKSILPCIGGLTIKETTELLMLSTSKYKSLLPEHVLKCRLAYMSGFRGLEIVDTDLQGYTPLPELQSFAQREKYFFLEHPDLRLRPRGLLTHGPAGTGKSAGAKYIAQQWGVPLLRLDSTVQDKYIGQSEQNLQNIFTYLEGCAPSILLIDECEKFFSSTNDSGVTQKLLGSLLWWMQEHKSRIFVYITTNDLLALPPELYRSGRISKAMEIGPLQGRDAIWDAAKTYSRSFDPVPPLGPLLDADNEQLREETTMTVAAIRSAVENFVKNNYEKDED